MKILSHRGLWYLSKEKNSIEALEDSLKNGFGLETDVRDLNGNLVISHDIPTGDMLLFEDFIKLLAKYESIYPLAINIKSDGLQNKINSLLSKYSITNYFVFDMSIPDTIGYIKDGMNVFIRQSEYENELPFYNEVSGVWVDCFRSEWIKEDEIHAHLNNGKKVCLVSPELHGRDKERYWGELKSYSWLESENIYLCTDFPKEAKEMFHA
jgi:hypothetical protein